MRTRSWTEFKEVAARRIPEAIRASLNPKGEITFDLDTYKKLNEPQAFVLLFERSTSTIGLKPANPDSANAVLVRARHARSNRVVRSKPFLSRHQIDIDRTVRFPYAFVENGVLILNLREVVNCGEKAWKPGRTWKRVN